MNDLVAFELEVAGDGVTYEVDSTVPHVQVSTRVRELGEYVAVGESRMKPEVHNQQQEMQGGEESEKKSEEQTKKAETEQPRRQNIQISDDQKDQEDVHVDNEHQEDQHQMYQEQESDHSGKQVDSEASSEPQSQDHLEEAKQPEIQVEIDPMQEYLQLQQEMLDWCQKNGHWVDRDFPCDVSQFYKDSLPQWAMDLGTIQWRRPHQLQKQARFMQKDSQYELKQGVFAESWFIGALATVATRTQLLQKLIVSSQHFDKGFVTFQFFKNGKWVQVTVDTVLPYERQSNSKTSIYSCCANVLQFWVQLMEKAYCKLHGGYEAICQGSIAQGLVDLTGGVTESFRLDQFEQHKKQQFLNQTWHNLQFFFNQKFLISCICQVKKKSAKNAQPGQSGILENHFYPIIDVRELAKEQLKLIRIRNPYGNQGVWTGPFSDDSEDWDKHRNLKEELKMSNKMSKKQEGSWWMSFSDWILNYTTVFINKIFPQAWQMYSIQGKWQGKTFGGPCPPKPQAQEPVQEQKANRKTRFKDLKKTAKEKIKVKPQYEQLDSDDRWFNNPQYRVKVYKDTKLYICLMLQDQKISKQPYIQTNFMVITNRNRKNRIWERPNSSDIVIEANPHGSLPPQREITTFVILRRFPGKKYGYYTIIPNVTQINKESKKEDKKVYFLRIFASERIDVTELPETLEHTEDGAWTDQSAGGKRKILRQKEKDKEVKDHKDKQPQYTLQDNPGWCRNPQYFLNLQKPTHLKIILRKTGAAGALKKLRYIKPGMTISNLNSSFQSDEVYCADLNRLLQQTSQQLKPPIMQGIERKLYITPQEKFKQSIYGLQDYSSLYFFWNPTQGPFIIVPSLEQDKKPASFKLTIYSNNPVQLQRLDQTKNVVMVGEWQQSRGCHLKPDWQINPKYLLTFNQEGEAELKITLAIADKKWKKQNVNTVKGMIGIYLLAKNKSKISYEDKITQTDFLPVQEIVLKVKEELRPINKNGYIIMPCTFESGIRGSFILSVSCNLSISLSPFK